MLIQYLALAGNIAANLQPTISGLSLFASTYGACSTGSPSVVSFPAVLRAAWTCTNPNDAVYEIHAALNGGAPVVLTTSGATLEDFSLAGLVLGNSVNAASRTDTVEVSVVRKSDAVAVQSLSASFTASYGTCS